MKYFISALIILFFSNISYAQKVSESEMQKIVYDFLTYKGKSDLIKQQPETEKIMSEKTKNLLFCVFNYDNAFIVISANKRNIPVKAFSFKHRLNTNIRSHLLTVLKDDYENFAKFLILNPEAGIRNYQKWENPFPEKNVKDATYGPFLSSLYGQVNCHDNNGNLVNVTNYYTPNHFAVGCVALTFTEVMCYYNWPRKGIGSFSYTDSYGNSTGTYDANFEEGYYNWGLIQDRYNGVASTDQSRSELGKLAFRAAVSVSMDFENSGSTSNINKVPSAVSKYFRYTADYKEKSAGDFWQLLDTNLHHNIPAQFAIYTSSGAGHAVVGDGIQYVGSEKYYHLNMGWWGDDNGWYQIHQTFNAGGYTNVTAAVLNMIPVPEIDENPELNFKNKTLVLKWYYSDKLSVQNYELQIKKDVNEWKTLTDTLTVKTYTFQTDGENDYFFRIRAKLNNNQDVSGWSNEIKIIPSDFTIPGEEDLTLHPTFVLYKLNISYKNLSGSIIKIFDLSGHLAEETDNVNDNEYSIDVSGLNSGFYILQILNENEKKSAKFFKL